MPMHNRCKCTVAPIVGSNDPGLKLNSDDLMTIYKAAGKTSGRASREGRQQQRAWPCAASQGCSGERERAGMASA